MNFNLKSLNALKPTINAKRSTITNHSLVIEQTAKGMTCWFKYKSPITGKTRMKKIGAFDYGRLSKQSLKLITDTELIYQSMVSIEKVDPIEHQKPETIELNVNQIWTEISNSQAMKKLSDNTKKAYQQTYHQHIQPVVGNKIVSDYNRATVKRIIDKLAQSMGSLVFVIFTKIEEHAVDLEYLPYFRLSKMKTKPVIKAKLLHFSADELMQLNTHLHQANIFPSIINVIWFQFMTGCRISEILGATWDEIDFDNGLWTIPATRIKTEKGYKGDSRPHQLPLMQAMKDLLLIQKPLHDKWVFPSARNSQIGKDVINKVIKKAGLMLTSHAIRRTVATNLMSLSGSEEGVKVILNHARVTGSTSAYINQDDQNIDRKTELLGIWHSQLFQLIPNPIMGVVSSRQEKKSLIQYKTSSSLMMNVGLRVKKAGLDFFPAEPPSKTHCLVPQLNN